MCVTGCRALSEARVYYVCLIEISTTVRMKHAKIKRFILICLVLKWFTELMTQLIQLDLTVCRHEVFKKVQIYSLCIYFHLFQLFQDTDHCLHVLSLQLLFF